MLVGENLEACSPISTHKFVQKKCWKVSASESASSRQEATSKKDRNENLGNSIAQVFAQAKGR